MLVKLNVSCKIYRDALAKSAILALSDADCSATITNLREAVVNNFDVEAGDTLTVNFGSVGNVKGLYVVANGSFILLLNGTYILELAKSAAAATEQVCAFIPATNLSEVVIDNTDGTATLSGCCTLYGDVAAGSA